MNLEAERKKVLDFLAGRPDVKLEGTRMPVRPVKEDTEMIVSQERKKEIKEIKNPRLKTEAYLKQIGKL